MTTPNLSRWPGARWCDERRPTLPLYVDVTLRRVADGEERVYSSEAGWPVCDDADDPLRYLRFWWTEGNGSCDCNRAAFFAAAGGESEPAGKRECSYDKYVIVAPEWLAEEE